MLVAFGENGIKTVEDLADCATDDLVGWTERSQGEGRRAGPPQGRARRLRDRPQGGRGHDHVGARARRLDQGRGSAAAETATEDRADEAAEAAEAGAAG